jgi:hypothetical protein
MSGIPVDIFVPVSIDGRGDGVFPDSLVSGGWERFLDIHVVPVLAACPGAGLWVDCPFGKWTPAHHTSPRPTIDGWIRLVREGRLNHVTNPDAFSQAFAVVDDSVPITMYTGDYYPEHSIAEIYASMIPFANFNRPIKVLYDGMSGRDMHEWLLWKFASHITGGVEGNPRVGHRFDRADIPWAATGNRARFQGTDYMNSLQHPGQIIWRSESQDGPLEEIVELVRSKPGRRLVTYVAYHDLQKQGLVRRLMSGEPIS